MLPILTVMCGLQGSGKSYKAREIKEKLEKDEPERKTVIISSDQIRLEHPELDTNEKVFKKVHADMNYWLRQGDNVILDATNITNKSRRQLFANLTEDCYKVCHIMNTPFELCKARLWDRNDKGEHYVPEEALDRYYHSFEIPFYEEGWNVIELDNIIDKETSDKFKSIYLQKADGFDQHNKHHTQDLGEHMKSVGDKLLYTKNEMLIEAGYYHDIGKLFTQTIGEDGNCHYYNHDSVGTYELMCNCAIYNENVYLPYSTIVWLTYINYHMKLHNAITDKAIRKWKNILGDSLYDNLRLFEQADKSRS